MNRTQFKKLYLTALLTAISLHGTAQQLVTIHGAVRDTSNHHVENANVLIWKATDQTISETKETDLNGSYFVDIATPAQKHIQQAASLVVINNGISDKIGIVGTLAEAPHSIFVVSSTGQVVESIPFNYNSVTHNLQAYWQSTQAGLYLAMIQMQHEEKILKIVTNSNGPAPGSMNGAAPGSINGPADNKNHKSSPLKSTTTQDPIKYYIQISSDGNEAIQFSIILDSLTAYTGDISYPEHTVTPILEEYSAQVVGQVTLAGKGVGANFKVILQPQQGEAQEIITDANGSFNTTFSVPYQAFPYDPATINIDATATPTATSIQTTNGSGNVNITDSDTPFTLDMAVDSAHISLNGVLAEGTEGSITVDGKQIHSGPIINYDIDEIKTVKDNLDVVYHFQKYHHEDIKENKNVAVWSDTEFSPVFTFIPAAYDATTSGDAGATITITKNEDGETLWNYVSTGTDNLPTIERTELDSILVDMNATLADKVDWDSTFYLKELEPNSISFSMQDRLAEYTGNITGDAGAAITITKNEGGEELWNYTSTGTDELTTIERTELDSILVNMNAQLTDKIDWDSTFYLKELEPNNISFTMEDRLADYTANINIDAGANVVISKNAEELWNYTSTGTDNLETITRTELDSMLVNISATLANKQQFDSTLYIRENKPNNWNFTMKDRLADYTANVNIDAGANVVISKNAEELWNYTSTGTDNLTLENRTELDSMLVNISATLANKQQFDSTLYIQENKPNNWNFTMKDRLAEYTGVVTGDAGAQIIITTNQNGETLWNYTSTGTDNLETISRNELDSIIVDLNATLAGKINFDSTFYMKELTPNNIEFVMQDEVVGPMYGRALGFVRREDNWALDQAKVTAINQSDNTQTYIDTTSPTGVYVFNNLPTDADGEAYQFIIEPTANSPAFLTHDTILTIYEGDNRNDILDVKKIPDSKIEGIIRDMDALMSIDGTLQDEVATRLPGVIVEFMNDPNNTPYDFTDDIELDRDTTDANGYYESNIRFTPGTEIYLNIGGKTGYHARGGTINDWTHTFTEPQEPQDSLLNFNWTLPKIVGKYDFGANDTITLPAYQINMMTKNQNIEHAMGRGALFNYEAYIAEVPEKNIDQYVANFKQAFPNANIIRTTNDYQLTTEDKQNYDYQNNYFPDSIITQVAKGPNVTFNKYVTITGELQILHSEITWGGNETGFNKEHGRAIGLGEVSYESFMDDDGGPITNRDKRVVTLILNQGQARYLYDYDSFSYKNLRENE